MTAHLAAPLAETDAALADLLLTLADDEFVIGYRDSEWTGVAPMLEEDVAFSSLAQDEIGHARAYYELLAELTGRAADDIAYGRAPDEYRHARLLDHPRGDWAFSIARRYLYDTADAVRLSSLVESSYRPLAELVTKVQREERYHLMHLAAWVRRLAGGGHATRDRLQRALKSVEADAASVFTPIPGEEELARTGVLPVLMSELAHRWASQVVSVVSGLGLSLTPHQPRPDGRGPGHGADFDALWTEFTSVYRSQPGAIW